MTTEKWSTPVLRVSSLVRVLKPPTLNWGSCTVRSISTDLREPSFHMYLMCLTEYASVKQSQTHRTYTQLTVTTFTKCLVHLIVIQTKTWLNLSILTNNVTGRHPDPKRKPRAGYWALSLKRTSHVAMRFHRRVCYRALSVRYACIRSSGIILIP